MEYMFLITPLTATIIPSLLKKNLIKFYLDKGLIHLDRT